MVKLFKRLFFLFIIILIFYIVKNYIFCFYVVNHDSMFPNAKQGDILIIQKISSTLKFTPKRNEIVIFSAPNVDISTSIIANYDSANNVYIKRVIAIENDYISFKDGKIYINNEQLDETYLDSGVKTIQNNTVINEFTVPKGYIFVMGDNRTNSIDSRNFGCIPVSKVKGIVIFRIFPLKTLGKL